MFIHNQSCSFKKNPAVYYFKDLDDNAVCLLSFISGCNMCLGSGASLQSAQRRHARICKDSSSAQIWRGNYTVLFIVEPK